MDYCIEKQRDLMEKGSTLIFPLSFIFSSIVNVTFFYTGFGFAENSVREYGFVICNLLFAAVCGIALLACLRTHRLSVKTWLLLGAVLLFYAVGFGSAFLCGRRSTPYYMLFLKHFIVFGLSSFFVGICGAVMRRETSFFEVLDSVGWFFLPVALMYLNGSLLLNIPKEWNDGFNLGVFSYMSVAYLCLPFLLAHVIGIVHGSPLKKPFSSEKFKHSQCIRAALSLIFIGAILASGTRGVLLAVCIGCILIALLQLPFRNIRPEALFPLAIAGLILFSIFVYAPPGFRRLSAFDMFLNGLANGQIVTTAQEPAWLRSCVDIFVAQDMPIPSDLIVSNRGTIFLIAWKEFLKNPLVGMGAFGYEIKYHQYPHSVIMELLCETGLLGTLFFGGLILFAVFRLFRPCIKRADVRGIVYFLLVYAILANIDSGLWDCSALMFALGYGLTYGDRRNALSEE